MIQLYKKLKDNNLCHSDLQLGNMGLDKKGNPILIDNLSGRNELCTEFKAPGKLSRLPDKQGCIMSICYLYSKFCENEDLKDWNRI